MRKIVLSVIIVCFTFITTYAQDDIKTPVEPKFGIKAGYTSTILKVSVDGASGSEDLSGFYLGFFGEFVLSDKIDLQPEINYGNYSQDGESSAILLVPVLIKYKANEDFSLLAGPQLDYLINEEDAEGLKRLGLGLTLGASYDIDKSLIIDARYTFGVTDRIDGDLDDFEDFNVEARFNYFQVGLGYRF